MKWWKWKGRKPLYTLHYRVCVVYALALQVSTENLLVLDYVIIGECMMDVSSCRSFFSLGEKGNDWAFLSKVCGNGPVQADRLCKRVESHALSVLWRVYVSSAHCSVWCAEWLVHDKASTSSIWSIFCSTHIYRQSPGHALSWSPSLIHSFNCILSLSHACLFSRSFIQSLVHILILFMLIHLHIVFIYSLIHMLIF